ncbi:MAG TPA: ABC transporter substrate-binding protein [Candidatus Limnocylindria bacterium]|nr:ABC transporter substrate-binding protein [Candidatus Limnocylindria bacterium]
MSASRFRFLLSLLLALAAACQPSTTASPSASADPTIVASPSAGAEVTYPLTVTDDAGREVSLPAEPQRIVSLAPSNTEIVCALDACDRLVGVTDVDDYPPDVVDVPDVVILAVVDIELVVEADPDLVLAAGNELTPSAVITELSDLGYPVVVLYPASLDAVLDNITLVGQVINAVDEAGTVVADMEARIAAVEEAVDGAPRPRTFYEVGLFEGAIYTAGEDSFLAGLIDIAGGIPVLGDALTTAIELEDLVAADPELILLGDAFYDASITPESVAARPGWGGLTAVQNGAIQVMTADPVITRPGPRIVDGLEALARAIHPDRFD